MQMPKLGVGTFRLKDRQAEDSVSMGLELGYRHIDTAQIYRNEADVGRAIAKSGVPRDALYVTTKIWTDQFGPGRLIPSLRESLDKLGLDSVDMTLIHWPSPKDEVPMAIYMTQLAEARQLGLTREIGVSNFTVAHLKQAVDAVGADAIGTHQLEVHPYLQNLKVRAFCREHGIALTGYMPLAYGRVVGDPTLRDIGAKHGATAAQVALAWQLQQGIAVIPSSTRRENLAANLGALSLRLDDGDMARIAGLEDGGRIADPDFAPAWDV
ncbi:2,5-didehydrogluconate reductase DkgB [Chromobacterium sp. ATCC 53434]|uniref:2,5-didehydrogluconate reductase DkgB n=1 Tax=Chromobacterium sp. (strain ATCC 53434 / SC 14030) TaxID=2059672 RepID=UPI000C75A7A2|nr:2,5-didehydrogluconate reductase DkgB [Chromobacterium sp. ATCC 53434]AUH49391.1 2,5-didehydrogluconate reductase DkgB [Chromobacterium sp. ATCC 53434]